MTKSMKSLMITAALSGLMGGTASLAQTQITPPSGQKTANHSTLLRTGLNADKEKHACKGQNSCKGKGGCKSGDNGCKGKNSCKGKGGCSTA